MENYSLDSPLTLTLARLVVGQLSPASVGEEQWDAIIQLALDQGVGGMLLWSLRQSGWAKPGESRWQVLVDWLRRSGRRELLLERTRRQAAVALEAAGIPAIWLKGIALAHTHYPEPHLRPMDDLDVLVPADKVVDGRKALLAIGFKQEKIDFFKQSGFALHTTRHDESLLDRTGLVKLELHFRLLVGGLHQLLDRGLLNWFWEQTVELAPNRPSFRVLKPEATLLHLCAHTILQNHGLSIDLLHLLDMHLLITQTTLDWDLFIAQAGELRWTYASETALGLLPALFGTPLPEGMLKKMHDCRPADEQPPVARKPGGSTPRWDEWRSVYSRMTTPQRLQLIWTTLFPPGVFLRQQYHLRPGQSLLPYYFHHFLDGGRELAQALRTSLFRSKRPTLHG